MEVVYIEEGGVGCTVIYGYCAGWLYGVCEFGFWRL